MITLGGPSCEPRQPTNKIAAPRVPIPIISCDIDSTPSTLRDCPRGVFTGHRAMITDDGALRNREKARRRKSALHPLLHDSAPLPPIWLGSARCNTQSGSQ